MIELPQPLNPVVDKQIDLDETVEINEEPTKAVYHRLRKIFLSF